jgi:hypothetical protein
MQHIPVYSVLAPRTTQAPRGISAEVRGCQDGNRLDRIDRVAAHGPAGVGGRATLGIAHTDVGGARAANVAADGVRRTAGALHPSRGDA